jgi:hypothetical protein
VFTPLRPPFLPRGNLARTIGIHSFCEATQFEHGFCLSHLILPRASQKRVQDNYWLMDSRFLHKVHDRGTAVEGWVVSGRFTVALLMMGDNESLGRVQSRSRRQIS